MTTVLRIAAALLATTSLGLAGCSQSAEDDDLSSSIEEGEINATMDELATEGPTYQAGTRLVTTANLNMRASGNPSASVLRVMPAHSAVTVAATSGANAWVQVDYNGYKGWAHTGYLSEPTNEAPSNSTPAATPGNYSSSRANTLAARAMRVNGRPSGGWCAREVSTTVISSGVLRNGSDWRRGNAWALAADMRRDTAYQNRVGFRDTNVSVTEIPKGSIIAWRPGQCGYHRTYGHIEITVDARPGRAASDFVGRVKTGCGSNPATFIPVSL